MVDPRRSRSSRKASEGKCDHWIVSEAKAIRVLEKDGYEILAHRGGYPDIMAMKGNRLREECTMISFFPHRYVVSKDEVLLTFNRQFLKYSGYTDEEIDALGDLSQIPSQELQKLIDRKNMQRLGLSNGNHQKVVPMEEVKKWIGEGWEFTAALPSGEAIIKLPTH